MLLVAVVAIIVVGPKDLPGMLRTFGQAMKKVRALAGDFQKQFDDAIRDAELDSLKDTVNDVRSLDPTKAIKDSVNPIKSQLTDVKQAVEADTDFDPKELFDEDKAPPAPEAQKVDVDAALERQRKIDAEFAKVAPSSGKNAVPGFGGPPAPSLDDESQPTEPDTPKPRAKPAVRKKTKAAAKTPATKTKPAGKSSPTKKTASKRASRKSAAARKPAKTTGKAKA